MLLTKNIKVFETNKTDYDKLALLADSGPEQQLSRRNQVSSNLMWRQ